MKNKASLRVAIDISPIVYGTGVSVYTQNLVENLLLIDGQNEYVLFGGSLRRLRLLEEFTHSLRGKFKKKLVKIPPTMADVLWNRMHIMPIELLTGKVDVFHSSDWTQPPSHAFKVTTIHDLSPIKFPQFTPRKSVEVHTRRLAHVKKEVDRIIVPSLATKSDLTELGYNEQKISVIPEAADPIFKKQTQKKIEAIKRKYGLNQPYFLSIGINPRKNTERIVNAYRSFKKQFPSQLLLTGFPTGVTLKPESGVITTGHVPKADLPALYGGAVALLYPSLYEGFGLPVLESFACECPVLASNISSLPEVVGNAGILVDPFSEESILSGIEKVVKNRKKLIKRGSKQVKLFTWQKTAEETIKVYQESN